MDVRLARPTDAPLVLSLALDESTHLVRSPSWPAPNPVTRSIASSFVPLSLHGRSWIAREGESAALLEAHPRRYVIGWDVARLAARGDIDRVLGPVLDAAACHLQARSVPRLFARCGDTAAEYLRRHDFQTIAREYVLLGPTNRGVDDGELPIDSRYRIPPDAWPLHQLESAITPPLIRQLEGMTSGDWSQRVKDMSEIVVERDGRLVAWIGWGTHPAPRFVDIGLMILPDYAELGPHLVLHALKHIGANERPVARVRDYQAEALRAFTDAGFEIAFEELSMLKHAGVELARAQKRRLSVTAVPSIPGFNSRLRARSDERPAGAPVPSGGKRICDGIA